MSLTSSDIDPSLQSAPAVSALPRPTPFVLSALFSRFLLLSICVALDIAALAYVPHNHALLGPLAPIAIVAFAAFSGLGYSWLKEQRGALPFSVSLFVVHCACIAAVCSANYSAFHSPQSNVDSWIQMAALRVVLVSGLAMLGLALIPLQTWTHTIRSTRWLGVQALAAGVLAWCLRFPAQSLWGPESRTPGRMLQDITFHAIAPLLHAMLPGVVIDPAQFVVGTDRFAVTIAEPCSGLEGIGLVLIFTTLWLWYFHKETRFPQALILVPIAVISVWALNIVRIAALVVIGNAGHPEIAMEGFHSQAGWIAFTLVALAFCVSARRIRWFQVSALSNDDLSATYTTPLRTPDLAPKERESHAVAAYLVPFLAILAASFISRAASGSFEWLYPLRFVAAALALWHYRNDLKQINWKFGPIAPLAGGLLFVLGLVSSHLLQLDAHSSLGSSLAALSPEARFTWIIFRIAAAVITIPLAEELAFRGYLARRLIRFSDPDFDQKPYRAITLLSMLLSAVAYGLMYGRFWFFGLISGLVYVCLAKWKSRLGDAVIAHATGSLLLVIWILSTGNWSLF